MRSVTWEVGSEKRNIALSLGRRSFADDSKGVMKIKIYSGEEVGF
jgi:hypothetical protein